MNAGGAIFLIALYFLPAIIAIARGHTQGAPIVIVNFFLGWTLVGWVVALAWSCSTFRGPR